MSKLFARAKVKYSNAESNYLFIGQDDAYLDETCYNLQQTIELALKYIVEMNGEEYIENHDVRAQMNTLDRLGVAFPAKDLLRKMASTLNSWEAESRYNDDFTAVIEDVDDARMIAKELIDYCEKIVVELNCNDC